MVVAPKMVSPSSATIASVRQTATPLRSAAAFPAFGWKTRPMLIFSLPSAICCASSLSGVRMKSRVSPA